MFYIRDAQGNKKGPLSAAEIKQMAKNGTVVPDTIIISQNGREVSASKYPGLFDQLPPVNIPEPAPIIDSGENVPAIDYEPSSEQTAEVAVPVSAIAIPQIGNQGTVEQQVALLSMTIKNASLLMKIALGLLGAILFFQIISMVVLSPIKPSSRYEYKIVSPRDSVFEKEMDEYGKQGWELISARRATGDYNVSYECILKRPLR
ncbi:MAG: DUF4177 domain-containing protein [Planctomycetaceae bacterium]|jgi:hypothetical protein|nr:DUF4177 domain-containing protein [Planctomycetaceae bacterium]